MKGVLKAFIQRKSFVTILAWRFLDKTHEKTLWWSFCKTSSYQKKIQYIPPKIGPAQYILINK